MVTQGVHLGEMPIVCVLRCTGMLPRMYHCLDRFQILLTLTRGMWINFCYKSHPKLFLYQSPSCSQDIDISLPAVKNKHYETET